jgi:hypothetical protein
MNKRTCNYLLIYIFIVFGLIRLLSVYRADIGFDLNDSPSYFNPSWIYPIRMPFISYIFSNLGTYSGIVVFQTLLGVLSWIFLAYAISLFNSRNSVKIISVLLILSLGVTTPIVSFDASILSESLTISIFNGIVASMILYFKSLKNVNLFMLLVLIIFYAGIKQSSAYISIVILFFIILFIFYKRESITTYGIQFILIVNAVLFTIFLIWISRQNDEINNNVEVTNIIERTYDDFGSQIWFKNRGFPSIAYQTYASPPFQVPINATRALPQMKAWEMYEKKIPIEQFAIKHPLFLLFAPLKPSFFIKPFTDNESVLASISRGYRQDKNVNMINLRTSNTSPFFLAQFDLPLLVWWSDNKDVQKFMLIIYSFVILLVLTIHFCQKLIFDHQFDFLIKILLAIFFVAVWANWHISVTYELDRYLMPWAILLRIIFILCLTQLLDSFTKRKQFHEN